MLVIDLKHRTTSDWNSFDQNKKSSDSLIFIDSKNVKDDGACCLDFTVGDRWFNQTNSQWYTIPEDGFILKSNESITIETSERLAVPLNIFGVVTGVGRNIYKGAMVSTGKIDPGFNGKLRIGFYNSQRKKIVIKKGQVLCACFFIQSETSIPAPLPVYIDESQTLPTTRSGTFKMFLQVNWDKILTIAIASLALIYSIFGK
jgi:deoxycytidine triphosphate deaminase